MGPNSPLFSYRKPKKKRKGNARLARLVMKAKGARAGNVASPEDGAVAEARRAEQFGILNQDGSRLLKKGHPRAKPKNQKRIRRSEFEKKKLK